MYTFMCHLPGTLMLNCTISSRSLTHVLRMCICHIAERDYIHTLADFLFSDYIYICVCVCVCVEVCNTDLVSL